MKKLFYTTGIYIALSFACSDSQSPSVIVFTNPQPEGAKELNAFPSQLLGEYGSDRNTNSLIIRPEGVFQNLYYKEKAHINELDSGAMLVGDSLIRDTKAEIDIPVRRSGDTLYMDFRTVDTLFLLNKKHILRKFRNVYILNTHQEKGWKVAKLEKKNKQLFWSSLDEKEADDLKTFSDTYIDSVPYQFHLSDSKFKEFLKSNGFTRTDTFRLKEQRRKASLMFKK